MQRLFISMGQKKWVIKEPQDTWVITPVAFEPKIILIVPPWRLTLSPCIVPPASLPSSPLYSAVSFFQCEFCPKAFINRSFLLSHYQGNRVLLLLLLLKWPSSRLSQSQSSPMGNWLEINDFRASGVHSADSLECNTILTDTSACKRAMSNNISSRRRRTHHNRIWSDKMSWIRDCASFLSERDFDSIDIDVRKQHVQPTMQLNLSLCSGDTGTNSSTQSPRPLLRHGGSFPVCRITPIAALSLLVER